MITFEGKSKSDIKGAGNSKKRPVPMQRQADFRLYDAESGKYITIKRPLSDDRIELRRQERKTPPAKKPHYRKAKNNNKDKKGLIIAGAGGLGAIIFTLSCLFPNSNNNNIVPTAQNAPETPIVVEETYDPYGEVSLILDENEDVNIAYNNLTSALETFSNQMGTDGLELIRQRVDEISKGKIDVIDVLKILWIESRGNVYDENGNILESYTNQAYGPFQLTPDTVDYINNYYGLNLDVMDPYDNLDACIYNLMFLKEQKETELEETGSLLTGNDDIMRAVFWGYHDGAWAEGITDHGEDYLNKYDELSAIDSYACVVDYIENGLC